MVEPRFTIGVEEEYLLVDPVSRDLLSDPPPEIMADCEAHLGGRVSPEFLRAQIEVGTPVCNTVQEVREQLIALRECVSQVAQNHGARMIAASTHPFATWQPQKTTDKERYLQLERDLGVPLRRLLICAMHVHVGVEDPDLRIDLMNQVRYFLPHLLALTTSSPFWQGEVSNLKSYRLAVFDELPRTGMPETYMSFGEYQKHLKALIDVGVIEDGTKVWWDVRPSARFPTLEMRICDVCTRIDDAVAVVALYLCLMRMLWRLKRQNVLWRRYKTFLIAENRWRAMRYGIDGGLIDFGRVEMVAYGDLLDEILEMTAEDAKALNCVAEVQHAHTILTGGTSAHAQIRVYEQALAGGADVPEALRAVVDWLVMESTAGIMGG